MRKRKQSFTDQRKALLEGLDAAISAAPLESLDYITLRFGPTELRLVNTKAALNALRARLVGMALPGTNVKVKVLPGIAGIALPKRYRIHPNYQNWKKPEDTKGPR